MEKLRIGINGFGRIGRMVLRNALERDDIEVVAINDILDIDYIAYLFKFDSAHRTFKGEITIKDNFLVINGSKIRITSYESPKDINWADVNAQYIAECTGRFLTKELASQHISAGAKKVVMSAPSKDDTPMFVCGVNLDEYKGEDIVSNASCTTN